jgi:hypothetical protein
MANATYAVLCSSTAYSVSLSERIDNCRLLYKKGKGFSYSERLQASL